jgi:hypothetical protein
MIVGNSRDSDGHEPGQKILPQHPLDHVVTDGTYDPLSKFGSRTLRDGARLITSTHRHT